MVDTPSPLELSTVEEIPSALEPSLPIVSCVVTPAPSEPSSTQPDSPFSVASPVETSRCHVPASRVKPTRRTENERFEQSLDKVYADFVRFEASKKLPHMEWNGSDFAPQRPAPQPILQVNATIMVSAHKKFGVTWKGSRRGVYQSKLVHGIADTGCQVPLAVLIFLKRLGAPKISSFQLGME